MSELPYPDVHIRTTEEAKAPGPLGQVFHRDNLELMRELPESCCDLIYADPPFFTGKTHMQDNGEHAVQDCWPGGLKSYLDFLKPRLTEMRRLLKPAGSLYVHLDWHAVHYAKVLLD